MRKIIAIARYTLLEAARSHEPVRRARSAPRAAAAGAEAGPEANEGAAPEFDPARKRRRRRRKPSGDGAATLPATPAGDA